MKQQSTVRGATCPLMRSRLPPEEGDTMGRHIADRMISVLAALSLHPHTGTEGAFESSALWSTLRRALVALVRRPAVSEGQPEAATRRSPSETDPHRIYPSSPIRRSPERISECSTRRALSSDRARVAGICV